MLEVLLTLSLWAVILLISEFLWRTKIMKGEYARKTVHILISFSIALTPYYLTWDEIKWLGAVGLLSALVVRFSGLFKGAYDIKRKSWGDILGPLAILGVIFLEPRPAVFMLILLHTGLADGVAALIGTRYGKRNSYKVFGYNKSLAGTAAFFMTSVTITTGMVVFGDMGGFAQLWPLLLLVPISTTIIENIGVYGIDNLLVTAATYLICSQLI